MFIHTNGMKKLAALLLSVFTIGTAGLCGCAETSDINKLENDTEIQMQETEEQNNDDCPKCREGEKRDGEEHPTPRRPHIRPHIAPDKKTPNPKHK